MSTPCGRLLHIFTGVIITEKQNKTRNSTGEFSPDSVPVRSPSSTHVVGVYFHRTTLEPPPSQARTPWPGIATQVNIPTEQGCIGVHSNQVHYKLNYQKVWVQRHKVLTTIHVLFNSEYSSLPHTQSKKNQFYWIVRTFVVLNFWAYCMDLMHEKQSMTVVCFANSSRSASEW